MSGKKQPMVRKLLYLPPELARQISDYRFEKRIMSEAEAVRQLLMAGLAAENDQAVD